MMTPEEIVNRLVADLKSMSADELSEVVKSGQRTMAELPNSENFPDGFELKEKYSMHCPYCEKSCNMMPGMAMQMGFNHGGGRCIQCKRHFQIRIDTRDNTAIGIPMEVPGA